MADDKNGFTFPSADEYAGMVFEDAGELTVNLADVQEMKFENVPKGTYVAVVDEAEYGMSKKSGSAMIKWTFSIAEGEYINRKLFFWTSFSVKALPGTKTSIGRIAPELINIQWKPERLCNEGYFVNKKVRVRVTHEDYDGEPRARVQNVLAYEGGADGGFFGG